MNRLRCNGGIPAATQGGVHPDAIAAWATDNGLGEASYAELMKTPAVQEMIGGYVDQLNSELNAGKRSRNGHCSTTIFHWREMS
ncbi:MAG TPA: hypothetical protein VLZ05_09205 [Mycobacterium sp.]|nr:hypothetical protein [Mycobacterium sp.]HUH69037.1 hypothetical protein [Mycobacterium sp.]